MSHYYDVIDTKTGIPIWQNSNIYCFAEYAHQHKTIFSKERFMRIFLPEAKVIMEEALMKKWCKALCLSGLPVKMQKVENLNRKIVVPVPKTDYYGNCPLQGKGYIFDFAMSNYRSPDHLKFALHVWRHCYESGLQVPLKKAFELKKEYPKISLFELLQFSYMVKPPSDGHRFYYTEGGVAVHIKSSTELKTLIFGRPEDYFDGISVNKFFSTVISINYMDIYLKDINSDKETWENPIVYKKKLKEWLNNNK